MKEKVIFVGVDVSKATLDICVFQDQQGHSYRIKNHEKAIRAFFKKVQKQHLECKLHVCMESTGYYTWPSYQALEGMDLSLYVVNPVHLKRSMGLVRGKNDKMDAIRIAKYIAQHYTQNKPSLIPSHQIRTMQALLAHRSRLIQTKTKFSVPSEELAFVSDKALHQQIQKSSQKMIREIQAQIKNIEEQLTDLIKNDPELYQQYQYITSVQGVGKVLAWAMLIKTNGFKSIQDPRKLACYAGVVPFDYQSGTSINKRRKVSFMADKTLKKLLHLSAMRAIQLKGDLKEYYQRKVKEGKNKMLVLNAVRNKIVARICSVVKNQRFYQADLVLS